ncbi:hypothetical protein [Yersinia ruckeri]|uniref:Uncharacterized protein n=1 Tax=Yersinia ruckeri TaxID=29486 RepID=A0A0A8VD94_YERRU|nr:hypothetical protein [Yersinia ruckeri]EEP97580.1 hypothetical protein yruck0001_100 [Yersinia ruckeri ATCC 29473]EKN4695559.1 hypothetical protein [Yersinia ruckeri]MCK8595378.1 hypothetical protein [Yersinia ruckeri]MCK8598679.1 hypothetical protein [Yersinia ruckeri]MCW6556137.1 hypothetical protein [Yersinia ruckeri]
MSNNRAKVRFIQQGHLPLLVWLKLIKWRLFFGIETAVSPAIVTTRLDFIASAQLCVATIKFARKVKIRQ